MYVCKYSNVVVIIFFPVEFLQGVSVSEMEEEKKREENSRVRREINASFSFFFSVSTIAITCAAACSVLLEKSYNISSLKIAPLLTFSAFFLVPRNNNHYNFHSRLVRSLSRALKLLFSISSRKVATLFWRWDYFSLFSGCKHI